MDYRQTPKPYTLTRDVVAYGAGEDAGKSRAYAAGQTVRVFDLDDSVAWLCHYVDGVFYDVHIPKTDLVPVAA